MNEMIDNKEWETQMNERVEMAFELAAVGDLETIMDAIDILYSVDWDWDAAVERVKEMNEFARVLSSVRPSPLRYRARQMIRHWIWGWRNRNKEEAF